jgi:hypothetical protein
LTAREQLARLQQAGIFFGIEFQAGVTCTE